MSERQSREQLILIGSIKGALVGFALGLKGMVVLAILFWAMRPPISKDGQFVAALCWLFSAAVVGAVVGSVIEVRSDAIPEKTPGSDDAPVVGDAVVDRIRRVD